MHIDITDLEAAINHWRALHLTPASRGNGGPLAPPLQALTEVYGALALTRQSGLDENTMPPAAHAAWLDWYATTPDTPCIAICSTSQGDEECKGCGRSFAEVQHWLAFTPVQKRAVWRRITVQASAWRFNRYAERAMF